MKLDYLIAVSKLKDADPILAAVIDRVGDCTLELIFRLHRWDVLPVDDLGTNA